MTAQQELAAVIGRPGPRHTKPKPKAAPPTAATVRRDPWGPVRVELAELGGAADIGPSLYAAHEEQTGWIGVRAWPNDRVCEAGHALAQERVSLGLWRVYPCFWCESQQQPGKQNGKTDHAG